MSLLLATFSPLIAMYIAMSYCGAEATLQGEAVDRHKIDVDHEVFGELQRRAEPLVDDANSVLRRVLGLDPAVNGKLTSTNSTATAQPNGASTSRAAPKRKGREKSPDRRRAPKGSLLPEAEYELPLLQALDEFGGSAPASEVVERVGEKLGDQLGPDEQETLRSGEVRWKNRVQFVRLGLIKSGQMKNNSPRGIWELADAGKARLSNEKGLGE